MLRSPPDGRLASSAQETVFPCRRGQARRQGIVERPPTAEEKGSSKKRAFRLFTVDSPHRSHADTHFALSLKRATLNHLHRLLVSAVIGISALASHAATPEEAKTLLTAAVAEVKKRGTTRRSRTSTPAAPGRRT
jgi:hypothetical protein